MLMVTGGTGFLGAYILKQLVEKGYRVRAIRRNESVQPFFISPAILEQVEWVEGDILDVYSIEEAMRDVDAVIHSAAMVSFSAKDKAEVCQVNIDGTATLVNIALETGLKRFVHISSVASLGRTQNGETVDEKKEWDDSKIHTTYAQSKFRGEMEVWRGAAEGLNTIILNPSTIIGYGDWNESSCAIFKTAYNEFPFYSEGVNGFVFVEDVAEAAVALMESEISQERFIVNGDNWSFRQLFNAMADGFNKKRPSWEATPFFAQLAWRTEAIKTFFSGKRSLITKESARVAGSTTYFNNAKLKNAFPSLRLTPLDDAIRESCRKYLEQLQ